MDCMPWVTYFRNGRDIPQACGLWVCTYYNISKEKILVGSGANIVPSLACRYTHTHATYIQNLGLIASTAADVIINLELALDIKSVFCLYLLPFFLFLALSSSLLSLFLLLLSFLPCVHLQALECTCPLVLVGYDTGVLCEHVPVCRGIRLEPQQHVLRVVYPVDISIYYIFPYVTYLHILHISINQYIEESISIILRMGFFAFLTCSLTCSLFRDVSFPSLHTHILSHCDAVNCGSHGTQARIPVVSHGVCVYVSVSVFLSLSVVLCVVFSLLSCPHSPLLHQHLLAVFPKRLEYLAWTVQYQVQRQEGLRQQQGTLQYCRFALTCMWNLRVFVYAFYHPDCKSDSVNIACIICCTEHQLYLPCTVLSLNLSEISALSIFANSFDRSLIV